MKKIYVLASIIVSSIAYSQYVGINTVDPRNELDVNGRVRVRTLDTATQPDYYASYDASGVLQKAKALRIVAAGVDTSSGPIDVVVPVRQDLTTYRDLGLTLSLSVPAGKKYGVNVFYSVPMGTVVGSYVSPSGATGNASNSYTFTTSTISSPASQITAFPITYTNQTITLPTNLSGYFGVGFYRNGVLMPEPTRKVTIPSRSGDTPVQMSTINSEYAEVLDNTAGASAMSVSYNLQGYIEHYGADTVSTSYGATVRFNMYSLPDPNYNWGRATISYILYELP